MCVKFIANESEKQIKIECEIQKLAQNYAATMLTNYIGISLYLALCQTIDSI